MGESSRALEILDASVREVVGRGVAHLTAEDDCLDGRWVRIGERPTLNFASCSYLGLELDPRLMRGAIEATRRYGTQFSSSRAYISAPQYEELESLLDEIFGGFSLVMPNTTLAHVSTLPVLISDEDAAILDHQVHHTVQLATAQLRIQGTHLEFVRHGRLDLLDAAIRRLRDSHRRVWYLGDGVYSMYGDFGPMKGLRWLLSEHEQLRLYIDDAHGMSWCGQRGRGFAREQIPSHERMVVAVSLNKAFGAAGGAVVLPDAETRRKVRTCGGPMIFTGPIQPPMLGAAVASARIHLSREIEVMQKELLERIRFANRLAQELELPLVSRSEVPLRFIGLGLSPAAQDMAAHLLQRGLFANCAAFPAVGIRRAGMRFSLTRHQSLDDVRRLLQEMASHLPTALAAAGSTREDVDRAFGLGAAPGRRTAAPRRPGARTAAAGPLLRCQHETSVHAIDPAEWDARLGGRGSFGWEGLALLESAFGPQQAPENHWRFHYYVVRDADGRPQAASFFSEALWKDDLLAPAKVSRAVEEKRSQDPFFLTSRCLSMGSLLTEGNHLFLDREGDWRSALGLLLAAVEAQREASGIETVLLRDLPADDAELDRFLKDSGFVRTEAPDSLVLDVDWDDREGFLRKLSKRSRKFHREVVMPWDDAYDVEVLRRGGRTPSDAEWAHLYALYQNVRGRNLELNTFALPEELLRRMIELESWEILALRLRPEHGGEVGAPPQGFVACYVGPEQYVPVLAGMDYRYIQTHALYRQLLAQALHRAEAHGSRRVLFGMGAELEKLRFGARREKRALYVQSEDPFHSDVLSLISGDPRVSCAS